MYLNTDPSEPENQSGGWKIHLKNGLRNFESYLREANNTEELENFKRVKRKVKKYVEDHELNLHKGVIVFADATETVWFAQRVRMQLTTEFYWEDTPRLQQLKELCNAYPRTGIVLVQTNQISVVETYLQEVTHTYYYGLDIDTDEWRQRTGPHKIDASMGSGGRNVQQEQFKARYEANKQRWYKSIAPKLDKLAKDNGWERLYIAGEPDDAIELKQQLNKPVDDVIQKNMLHHEETKVVEEVAG
ncbi:VLRF1 family aeRF1-type release factor [Lentibacillus cibarius]|uniref:VLRF1 family aeRF1-type release factor n=1 Tax=Lentibacillus cibarius TaxID=2583219 RepID=UPI0026845217|nr:VLRF1 family aeRF1-type release factor [Lentibacillus cibarius]